MPAIADTSKMMNYEVEYPEIIPSRQGGKTPTTRAGEGECDDHPSSGYTSSLLDTIEKLVCDEGGM